MRLTLRRAAQTREVTERASVGRRGSMVALVTPLSRPIERPQTRSVGALAAAVALAVAVLSAEPLTTIPNPRTRDATWVTDVTGTLRPETVATLNATIGEMERTSGAEMAVVVIRSLDGRSIDEAAVELFELWKIGKTREDNGVLLLWSTGDRRVRVEVGYGLEGRHPDGKVGAILDADVIPRFQAGQFDEGMIAGVQTLARVVGQQPVSLPSPRTESYEGGWFSSAWQGVLVSIPIGAGALLGVRRWRRYRRRRCPQCQGVMALVSEAEEDARLRDAEQMEERIGSVDYDVWTCPSCAHHFTLRYPWWFSRYAPCPQCHNKTMWPTETVITAATTSSSGSARVVEECAFCNYTRDYVKALPRISESSSSSSSGGGSSFGGGSSGGGGASRGY